MANVVIYFYCPEVIEETLLEQSALPNTLVDSSTVPSTALTQKHWPTTNKMSSVNA